MGTSKKIKVLQTIRQGLVGGGETHVLGLVEQLDKSRFEPVVLSFTDGPMITRLNEMGIKNYVIPSLKAFDIRQWQRVKSLLRKEEIDLVHAHGSRAASNLLVPTKALGLPILYTIHGWSFHDDQPFVQKKVRVFSEKFITNRVNHNISVSASNQATGVSHFGKFSSTVINNGVDPVKFNPEGNYKNIRQELNIPEHHTLVSYIARITVQKDPLTMIKGFAEALSETQDLTLLVVGDGELKGEMMDLAGTLGIQDKIVYQPFRADVPDILYASDVYCLPSLWEGLPIGLLEAMAMETAVVATNVDGSREIIKHLENGYLIEPRNPGLLAKAIIKLHTEKFFRAMLQKNAVKTIQEQYSIHSMARRIEALYEDVLKTPN